MDRIKINMEKLDVEIYDMMVAICAAPFDLEQGRPPAIRSLAEIYPVLSGNVHFNKSSSASLNRDTRMFSYRQPGEEHST